MAKCPNGHEVAIGVNFCSVCGAAVGLPSTPESAASVVETKPISSTVPAPRRRRRRLRAPWLVFASGVLLVIGIFALIGAVTGGSSGKPSVDSSTPTTTATQVSATPPPTKPRPKLKGYAALLPSGVTVRSAASAACPRYKTVIDGANSEATRLLADSENVTDDPFAASDYIASTSWTLDSDHAVQLQSRVRSIASGRLQRVAKPKRPSPKMVTRFTADSLFVCKETLPYSTALALSKRLDSRAGIIQTEADLKPWYPKGYYEFSDGIAWRWESNPSCDIGDLGGACWGIDVIARDGCPSSLYAEINILDSSGTAIDYSNDTLGALDAGQSGRLTFETFNDAAHTARMQEIDCY